MTTQSLEYLTHPPEKLVAFITQVIDEHRHYEGPERRSRKRESLSIPVEVQPLGVDFQPEGKSFICLTKNLSGGGIGIVHSAKITSKYLKITLRKKNQQALEVLAELRHCTPHDGLYEIGGRFVVDWSGRQ